MSRAVIVIDGPASRAKAAHWVSVAPFATRVEFKRAKLTDVASQIEWHGQKLTPDDWKLLLLDALNREVRVVPAIDGRGFVNLGRSSSDLSKSEMGDLMELIAAFGAERGVTFKEPDQCSVPTRSQHG